MNKCPLCGSTHLSIIRQTPMWGGEEKEVHIVCNDCACSAPEYSWSQKPCIKKTPEKCINMNTTFTSCSKST